MVDARARNGRLAAAKRGGRGRGRGRARGSVDDGAERRVALLRRLNQITAARLRLERRAGRGDADESAPKRRRNAAVKPAETDTAIDSNSGETRATRFQDADVEDRNRVAEARADDALPASRAMSAGASRVAARATRHHSPNSSTRAQTAPHAEKMVLDSVPPVPNAHKLDLMLVEADSRRAGPTPPATPSASARGSGRVRTPSVLLSSQPGEAIPPLVAVAVQKNKQLSYCLRMVKDMLRLKDAYGFSKPIDQLWAVDQLPGYFEMITKPMDLDTVRQRLEAGVYLMPVPGAAQNETKFDIDTFATDMRLIFNNARTYNREGDQFYQAATRLLEKFESKMAALPTPAQIAATMAKKSKKRRKNQHLTGPDGERKGGEGSKRRKTGAGGGGAHTTGGGDGSKRKSSGGGGRSRKAAGGGGGGDGGGGGRGAGGGASAVTRNTESEISASRKDSDKMSVRDMELRLRALKRQRTLTEAGSPASSPAAGGASYLAQAQALYQIAMSYEEKVQLSENVEKLPGDKLQKLVTLATKNKSSSMEVNNNEEIELDIDRMDNKTLRDMEAFVNQTLFKKKGSLPGVGPNSDVIQMSRSQVIEEMDRLTAALSRRTSNGSGGKRNGSADAGADAYGDGDGDGDGHVKKQRSFYDADSSSEEEDSDGSGSSDDESDSEDSDSSGDESDGALMRKRRERNLAHQQAMQAAGTPLPSPAYVNNSANAS